MTGWPIDLCAGSKDPDSCDPAEMACFVHLRDNVRHIDIVDCVVGGNWSTLDAVADPSPHSARSAAPDSLLVVHVDLDLATVHCHCSSAGTVVIPVRIHSDFAVVHCSADSPGCGSPAPVPVHSLAIVSVRLDRRTVDTGVENLAPIAGHTGCPSSLSM